MWSLIPTVEKLNLLLLNVLIWFLEKRAVLTDVCTQCRVIEFWPEKNPGVFFENVKKVCLRGVAGNKILVWQPVNTN